MRILLLLKMLCMRLRKKTYLTRRINGVIYSTDPTRSRLIVNFSFSEYGPHRENYHDVGSYHTRKGYWDSFYQTNEGKYFGIFKQYEVGLISPKFLIGLYPVTWENIESVLEKYLDGDRAEAVIALSKHPR